MTHYPRFHIAVPVDNLAAAEKFYTEVMGCALGRTDKRWIDFNFFGHQLSVHLRDSANENTPTNAVDGEKVPARHFGVILDWKSWHELRDRLMTKNIQFIIKPQVRFKGKVGEQATMFFPDPSGNAIEIKGFKDESQIFAA